MSEPSDKSHVQAEPVPSRFERILRGTGHIGLTCGAVYGAFGQLPKSLLFSADPVQLVIWITFLATGVVAGVGAFRGRFLIEYAMLPFMAGGTLIYLAAMVWIVITGENLGSGLAAFFTLSLTSYIGARWVSLHQLLNGPKRWKKQLRKLKKSHPDEHSEAD